MSMQKTEVALLSARCCRRQAEGHGRLLCGADSVLTRGGPLQDRQGGKFSYSVFYLGLCYLVTPAHAGPLLPQEIFGPVQTILKYHTLEEVTTLCHPDRCHYLQRNERSSPFLPHLALYQYGLIAAGHRSCKRHQLRPWRLPVRQGLKRPAEAVAGPQSEGSCNLQLSAS